MEAFTGHYDSFLVAFVLSVETFTGKTLIDAVKVCDGAPQLGFALVYISVRKPLQFTLCLKLSLF